MEYNIEVNVLLWRFACLAKAILFHSILTVQSIFLVKLTFNVVILYLINEAFIYIKGFHDEKIKVIIYNSSSLSGHISQE